MYMGPLVLLVFVGALAGVPAVSPAQSAPPPQATGNPLQDDPAAIRNGEAIFRARCAGCHGLDARGLTGPDLTGLWAAGLTEAQLFHTVQQGVPGSEMPPFDTRSQVDEIWETLAYLRTRNVADTTDRQGAGDAATGQRLFRTHCLRCHVVNGEGGVLGPDLSRIGSARPRAVLAEKIRGGGPIRSDYQAVTLVTSDGRQVLGIRKNEDDFSIQVMDLRERLHGFLKKDVTKLVYQPQSMMPPYTERQIDARALNDLVEYLATLRVNAAAR